MSSTNLSSEKYLLEKLSLEAQELAEYKARRIRERRMLLGYFVVSLLATLLISGAFRML